MCCPMLLLHHETSFSDLVNLVSNCRTLNLVQLLRRSVMDTQDLDGVVLYEQLKAVFRVS